MGALAVRSRVVRGEGIFHLESFPGRGIWGRGLTAALKNYWHGLYHHHSLPSSLVSQSWRYFGQYNTHTHSSRELHPRMKQTTGYLIFPNKSVLFSMVSTINGTQLPLWLLAPCRLMFCFESIITSKYFRMEFFNFH